MSEGADKMRAAGLSDAAILAFERALAIVKSGERPEIAESAIAPADRIPSYAELDPGPTESEADLLAATVVIKLNGGLGTGMGLERAKSLLEVRDGLSFIDLIARQVLAMRERHGDGLRFLLMNSYATSADTAAALAAHPQLGDPAELELLQNRVPKLDAETLRPVTFPPSPDLEWCPPGHGDLYPALAGSGWLDRLLAQGVRYAFVSNSDNLGATLDPVLLSHFAAQGMPFLMEVTARTAADRKGGHLARCLKSGGLLLRESAQCARDDAEAFQDIARHRFFNTNNLWLRLDALRERLAACEGVLPLPVIVNRKTVDPRDADSIAVIQLETAMGAAIQCFEGAAAVDVPRSRFAPVKTTADLFALRSDAYTLTADSRLELDSRRAGVPPVVSLDPAHFKLADQLDAALEGGVPSLIACDRLDVRGPVSFQEGTTFAGEVNVVNASAKLEPLPAGDYADEVVEL